MFHHKQWVIAYGETWKLWKYFKFLLCDNFDIWMSMMLFNNIILIQMSKLSHKET